MATTAPHYLTDIDAMTLGQLQSFVQVNYAELQEYAKLLALAKQQTTAGQTAAAAATTAHALARKNRIYGVGT